MNELQAFDFNGVEYSRQRQTAEMLGKRHVNLMRDIDSYLAIMRKPVNLLKNEEIENPNTYLLEILKTEHTPSATNIEKVTNPRQNERVENFIRSSIGIRWQTLV